VSPISDRVGPPATPPATATAVAATIARRSSDDARPSDAAPEPEAGRRPGPPHARYTGAAPDPSGRSGSLIDVFA